MRVRAHSIEVMIQGKRARDIKRHLRNSEHHVCQAAQYFNLGDSPTTGELLSLFDRVGASGQSAIPFLLGLFEVVVEMGASLSTDEVLKSLQDFSENAAANHWGDREGGLVDAHAWAVNVLNPLYQRYLRSREPSEAVKVPVVLNDYLNATVKVGCAILTFTPSSRLDCFHSQVVGSLNSFSCIHVDRVLARQKRSSKCFRQVAATQYAARLF